MPVHRRRNDGLNWLLNKTLMGTNWSYCKWAGFITGRKNKADREATKLKCEAYIAVRRNVSARSDNGMQSYDAL